MGQVKRAAPWTEPSPGEDAVWRQLKWKPGDVENNTDAAEKQRRPERADSSCVKEGLSVGLSAAQISLVR